MVRRGVQKLPAELQSISIDINLSSDSLEANIYSIDSTNSKLQLRDVKDIGTDEYPNNSEFSDDDIIEIVSESEEIELDTRVQVFRNDLEATTLTSVATCHSNVR